MYIFLWIKHIWGKNCWCQLPGEELQGEEASYKHKEKIPLRIQSPVDNPDESDISKTVLTPYGKANVKEIRPDGMVVLQSNGMIAMNILNVCFSILNVNTIMVIFNSIIPPSTCLMFFEKIGNLRTTACQHSTWWKIPPHTHRRSTAWATLLQLETAWSQLQLLLEKNQVNPVAWHLYIHVNR